MSNNRIVVSPSLIVLILGSIATLLVSIGVLFKVRSHLSGIYPTEGPTRFFHLNFEGNLPAYFSSSLLLLAAMLLGVVTALEKNRASPQVFRWGVLCAGFLFMAMDEAVSLHEKLIWPVRGLIGSRDLGFFYFSWVIPGIVLVSVLGLYFLRFLLHLPRRTRLQFLLAGTLYVSGALGLELIAGRHVEIHGMDNLTNSLLMAAEESLEMAGVIVFIKGLLEYLATHHRDFQVGFKTGMATSTSV